MCRFGWRAPVGMAWSTEDSLYKDLYVYYDSESRETINNLADVVFPAMSADKCCPSVPVNMPGREDGIRGSVIVIRAEPPRFVDSGSFEGKEFREEGQMDYPFDQLITHQEIKGMYNKAIGYKGEPLPWGTHYPGENKNPVPTTPGMEELAAMATKMGMNVQFHKPGDNLDDMMRMMGMPPKS